ncbi:PadR family transcriptional regulator [Kitasatospora kifunensis]|uniref:DNA-binding PadR family transcriptional regulator n=1 Tax=Kitasatospora kifunensis TaxID=58351 RepID=A0A7W7VVK4_KITKI|nr:PadR family transcriptional regulator [Kitasatospora kifunensis]MBB4923595.1 DNA-binding PadR family transcriptional regulator [Kitasatospora kifunensis]
MSSVFAHGRLRLYLLKLLEESPRHGYEVIRLLEERFHGLYAPSAGTVYPRLAKLEQEGLVEHSTEGGRKVYRITDVGRAELTERQDDLAELEVEISDSVSQLAGAIRDDVRDSAKDLREELRDAVRSARQAGAAASGAAGAEEAEGGPAGAWAERLLGDPAGWQRTKEEFAEFKAQAKRAKEQERAAKEQAKRAKEEARKAREQSQAVRQAAQQEALRIKRRVEQQVREHVSKGDWPTGLAEGLSELTRGLTGLADPSRWDTSGAGAGSAAKVDLEKEAPADLPDWARSEPGADPARELERLLDRFRDQVRDASRDGAPVTAGQLGEAQAVLAAAGERLRRLLG